VLVLTRHVGQEIVIDGNIRVTVLGMRGEKVRLGIEAPTTVAIHRSEIHARYAGTEYRPKDEFVDAAVAVERH
jgi:carbon storage regulator